MKFGWPYHDNYSFDTMSKSFIAALFPVRRGLTGLAEHHSAAMGKEVDGRQAFWCKECVSALLECK